MLKLNKIEAVNTVNDNVSLAEILISLISGVVWNRRLIDAPVVKRWVVYWISGTSLHYGCIIRPDFKRKAKTCTGHLVCHDHRFRVYKDWNTINLKSY